MPLLQADYALSRLVTLKERTEATESLAKMHLAQRRNELVSFDLMLTVISINIAFVGGVASLCGMNLWLAGSNAPSVCHAASVLFAYCMQRTRLLAFVRTKMTAGILLMACMKAATCIDQNGKICKCISNQIGCIECKPAVACRSPLLSAWCCLWYCQRGSCVGYLHMLGTTNYC